MHFWKPWKINSLYFEKSFQNCKSAKVRQRISTWSRLYHFPTDFYTKRALPRMAVMITLLPSFFLSDMVKTSSLLHLHKFWRALDQSDQITSCWLMFQPQGMVSILVHGPLQWSMTSANLLIASPLWSGARTKVFSTLLVT